MPRPPDDFAEADFAEVCPELFPAVFEDALGDNEGDADFWVAFPAGIGTEPPEETIETTGTELEGTEPAAKAGAGDASVRRTDLNCRSSFMGTEKDTRDRATPSTSQIAAETSALLTSRFLSENSSVVIPASAN
jgi:hypothetical protein